VNKNIAISNMLEKRLLSRILTLSKEEKIYLVRFLKNELEKNNLDRKCHKESNYDKVMDTFMKNNDNKKIID
jgi:hypothetical protein